MRDGECGLRCRCRCEMCGVRREVWREVRRKVLEVREASRDARGEMSGVRRGGWGRSGWQAGAVRGIHGASVRTDEGEKASRACVVKR